MSVEVLAGRRRNWLEETPEHARLLRLQSPILTNPEIVADSRRKGEPFPFRHPFVLFPGGRGLEEHEAASRSYLPRGRKGDRRGRDHPCPERLGHRRAACADPDAARRRLGPSSSHPGRQAFPGGAYLRDGRVPRRSSARLPARLRRLGGQSLHRLRHPQRSSLPRRVEERNPERDRPGRGGEELPVRAGKGIA